ncbi:MAG: glutamate-5-semialdehyde dehydrogenase [Blastocatellia bacterium]|nr:glutamate-5-semialdehyde dehydrogenase [Blastocatellia bacterium]
MTETRSIVELAKAAREASRKLALASTEVKNSALQAIADALIEEQAAILEANQQDCKEVAELVAKAEMAKPLLDRLKLDAAKLGTMAESVRAVASLDDPVGQTISRTLLDDGLELQKVTCPLGVLAIIFESRPDAVTQISALALKSGNAALLKGGREAARSNQVLLETIWKAIRNFPELTEDALILLTEREQINSLLSLDNLIDLVIPRGSNELVRYIQSNTKIPVLGHAEGLCHIYIDESARLDMALDIVCDAKLQYPAACNAVETILVHSKIAPLFLPELFERLTSQGVELRCCERTKALLDKPDILLATEQDWQTEYCGLIVSIKIVDAVSQAIDHINLYGSGHTDSIITEDRKNAESFLNRVDSAGVYHNASTRFADGFRYGFGAEVGISTNKIHARGPVGLDGLLSYKYKLYGCGQTVSNYSGSQARPFKHKKLV